MVDLGQCFNKNPRVILFLPPFKSISPLLVVLVEVDGLAGLPGDLSASSEELITIRASSWGMMRWVGGL